MLSEYYLKGATDLDVYRDRVDRWSRRELHEEDPEMRRRYYEEIQGLESKCSAAEIALNTCKFAEPEDESARQKLEEALTDLREAMDRFIERFGVDED
ncbi:MAG: hypothetical protein ACOYEW_07640 [Anaerolineae bacterium]|jgi:hypothetical protein